MNGTPRLRSAFPSTPRSTSNSTLGSRPKAREHDASEVPTHSVVLPTVTSSTNNGALAPLVPFSVVDAPTQRLYITLFYLGLTIWRFYDFSRLVEVETDSLWLFMKWVAIDSAFFYGLPALRVPWMQWSSSTTTILFLTHGALNAVLMFRISIPVASWIVAFTKLFYDRELAIAEISVKPANILHNSSLILGKQIIHILPEGSATLNMERKPLCLGSSKSSVGLSIHINQTNPILIELLRIDLDTNINETITITNKEIKRLQKQSNNANSRNAKSGSRTLELSVKKTGLYRLQKVMDESNLEVRRKKSDTLVVSCPAARVRAVPRHKCKGDLSDFNVEIEATPPFKVKYTKTVNQERYSQVVLSIHPESLNSPLDPRESHGTVATLVPESADISWARVQIVNVPLNESLGASGQWEYAIDEIYDACGNSVDYSSFRPANPTIHGSEKDKYPGQTFMVHERPRIAFDRGDPQAPLMVPKGKTKVLPMLMGSTDEYTVSYLFTPYADLHPNQEHATNATRQEVSINPADRQIRVTNPGLYTLISVRTPHCTGEVIEPSSCLVINPPEPDLEIMSEEIPDKCAGSSIGLRVNLNMVGTPPFRILYHIRRGSSGSITPKIMDINRHQMRLDLKPSKAGDYTYEFIHISDSIYKSPRSLETKKLVLEQAVKPPASARFSERRPVMTACIEQSALVEVHFRGEAPWKLEYEIVYNGQRQRLTEDNISTSPHRIQTKQLMDGGVYSMLLISVADRLGCKVLLEEEMKIEVGLQKAKAAFGQLDGKRIISALVGKNISLPLRLQGEPPWIVNYRNRDRDGGQNHSSVHIESNDHIVIGEEGTYEIVGVHDRCPGSVDMSANLFVVRWIPRPAISIGQTSMIRLEGETYIKGDVCENDEDSTDIIFSGTAPYTVEYNQYFKSERGVQSKRSQQLTSGLNSASFKMETSQSGLYQYEFSRLGDNSYSQAARGPVVLKIQQRVQSKPSARFTNIGKTYRYCKGEGTGDEVLPIVLNGRAPFSLEIDIRHHAATKPERISLPHIDTNLYDFHIPHKYLALGTHVVTIRKVRDSHGCVREMDFDAPHVQVSVADVPVISPLEANLEFCVGDRISFSLSGTPPFNIYYKFQDVDRKATVSTTTFRRIAEKQGEFEIIGISDQRSTDACISRTSILKKIHEMPSVKISKGKTVTIDIHEGATADILFEFSGTPPFEFTYTRSTYPSKGQTPEILETKTETSYEYAKTIQASDEGVYEVVSIKDSFCSFSTQRAQGKAGQKLLTYY